MSIFQDCDQHVDITEFTGPDLLMNDEDTTASQCLSCRNVEYVKAQVRTRRGFKLIITPSFLSAPDTLKVMYSWVQQQYNRLITMFKDNIGELRIFAYNLDSGTTFTIMFSSIIPDGGVFLQAGYRLYMAYFTTAGLGAMETRVWDGTFTGGLATPNVDIVFREPLRSIADVADGVPGIGIGFGTWTTPSTGFITPGVHAFTLVVTCWNGYQTAPGPWSYNAGQQLNFAVVTASLTVARKIHVSISPGYGNQGLWANWIKSVQIAMTPALTIVSGATILGSAGEGARWFLVPGQSATVTRGTATAITFDINIDDVTLLGEATEITNTLFNLYHATVPAPISLSVTGGGLVSVVVASNLGTVTTVLPHGLALGTSSYAFITGCTGDADLNTSYFIASIASATQFVIFTTSVSDGTYNNAALTLVYTPAESGPTSPHCIISLNNRTVYLTRLPGPDGTSLVGSILISEPNAPQWVTLSQHMLNLPEFRDTVTGFALAGTLYVLGPNWTYAFSDNLRVPVLWAPPRLVSGSIGSPFIRGVSVNQDKGYSWVADHTGLYFFTGTNYPVMPASYNQKPDWDRINFGAAANALRVIESVDDRLVIVRAPLDGEATISNYLMVWDYTYGVDPDKIRYCGLWNIGDGTLGDIEIVQAATSKIKEFWANTDQTIVRLKSIEAGDATDTDPTNLYDDNSEGIDSAYKYLCVSDAAEGPQMQVGIRFRERGIGQINITAESFDGTQTQVLDPITAGENTLLPGKRWDRFVDMQTAAISYEFDNGAIPGSFFWLTAIRAYFNSWMGDYE